MKDQKKYFQLITIILILTACECFFFRNILFGSTSLFGNIADGRLTMLLTEHWWSFFCGKESFSDTLLYYPLHGTTGYTDMLLGFGIIHSLFRLLGMNMYTAYKFTIIFVHFVGTLSTFYLFRKTLRCNNLWSIFGTLAFSFSDTFSQTTEHTQLVATSILPIMLIFFISYVRSFEQRKKRNIYAYLFILFFVLLTYTSWYTAFFLGFFVLIYAILYIVNLKFHKISISAIIKNAPTSFWKDLILYFLITLFLFLPFIQIYIPILKQSSGYSYAYSTYFLPELIDLIHVSDTNLMLGHFMQALNLSSRPYSYELAAGYSIVLLIMFLITFIIMRKKNRNTAFSYYDNAVLTGYISIIVCFLCILRLSYNGVSLWFIVSYILPISHSVRAVVRLMFWLSFPMTIVTTYVANQHYVNVKILPALLCIFVFIFNINTVGAYTEWDQTEEENYLSAVPAPPKDAEAFYLIDTSGSWDEYVAKYQMEAFEIATIYSLPTINGYPAQTPPYWGGIWNLCSEDYETYVALWIKAYNLENVYAYDRATCTWISHNDILKSGVEEKLETMINRTQSNQN